MNNHKHFLLDLLDYMYDKSRGVNDLDILIHFGMMDDDFIKEAKTINAEYYNLVLEKDSLLLKKSNNLFERNKKSKELIKLNSKLLSANLDLVERKKLLKKSENRRLELQKLDFDHELLKVNKNIKVWKKKIYDILEDSSKIKKQLHNYELFMSYRYDRNEPIFYEGLYGFLYLRHVGISIYQEHIELQEARKNSRIARNLSIAAIFISSLALIIGCIPILVNYTDFIDTPIQGVYLVEQNNKNLQVDLVESCEEKRMDLDNLFNNLNISLNFSQTYVFYNTCLSDC